MDAFLFKPIFYSIKYIYGCQMILTWYSNSVLGTLHTDRSVSGMISAGRGNQVHRITDSIKPQFHIYIFICSIHCNDEDGFIRKKGIPISFTEESFETNDILQKNHFMPITKLISRSIVQNIIEF